MTGKKSSWPGLFSVDATHFLALYATKGTGAVSQIYGLAGQA